jgi:hypothetical protein
MKAKIDIHQEKMETAKHYIGSETIKRKVEDFLSCIEHMTHCLRKEMTEKTDETQVNLRAEKESLDTRTKILQETLTDTKNDFHEEARKMKAEIRINQERMEVNIEVTRRNFQTQLKDAEAGTERGIATRNAAGSVRPPKFDGTRAWAVFRRQFETVEEYNCGTRQEKSESRKARPMKKPLRPWRTVSETSTLPPRIAVI